jgi:serine/threonine protein phosphatase PrpC
LGQEGLQPVVCLDVTGRPDLDVAALLAGIRSFLLGFLKCGRMTKMPIVAIPVATWLPSSWKRTPPDRPMRWEQPVRFAALSDLGLRRQNNEDAATVRIAPDRDVFRRRGHLFVVADGMGGHAVGELASRIATESLPLTYLKSRQLNPGEALREAITAANAAIHGKGQANFDFARMGTTCTALVLSEHGAFIGHVGDSRCYRVRRGRIDQLTFDHSLQWELIRRGGMSPEEVFLREPRNVITRSLGPEPAVEVDVEGPYTVLAGDVYVLCSDGLPNHVADHEIGAVAAHLPPAEAARLLVHLANARGGTDNVTAIVVQVGALPTELAGEEPPDPTVTPSPWLLALAWGIAAVFLVGVILLVVGRYVEGVVTAGVSITALAATLFRMWQLWYRRPRERPLHGEETVHWRPYRTASATLTDEFLKVLARVEADLHRAAEEEHWPVKQSRHEAFCAVAREALSNGRRMEALDAFGKAIDSLMRGMTRHRRPEADPLPDLVSDSPD